MKINDEDFLILERTFMFFRDKDFRKKLKKLVIEYTEENRTHCWEK